MPIEVSPAYVGVARLMRDIEGKGRSIGGTFVEPLLYGAKSTQILSSGMDSIKGAEAEATLATDALRTQSARLNLQDLLAISGSAPAEFEWMQMVAFPRIRTWAHVDATSEGRAYAHADGGLSENLAIMPLLARRVPNIVVFVNGGTGLTGEVEQLFGVYPKSATWRHQAVFPKSGLQKLRADLEKLGPRPHGPMVAYGDYVIDRDSVDDLDPFGINIGEGTYRVKVAWFFLNADGWYESMKTEGLAKSLQDDPRMKRFPDYRTFFENVIYIIDLNVRQVTALAHLTSWCVVHEDAALRQHFGIGPSTRRAQ